VAKQTKSTAVERNRSRVTLTDISSRAWEHPADKGALVALRQLRGFDFVVRKLAALWNERALRLVYLGSAVRVDHRQFSRVDRLYADVLVVLDVKDRPELYVLANPFPHAMAIGIDRPIIVVTSGLLDLLDDEELRFVLGHELGHVLSGHALYTTMLMQLLRVSNTLSWLPLGSFGLRALIAALHEWARKAELSGDRAGLLAGQDPAAALRVHMKLASGGHLDDLDITAFRGQGEEYLASPDIRDSLLKLLLLEARSHPFAVVRAAELQRWIDGDGEAGTSVYLRILQGDYPRRVDDAKASIRKEAAEAAKHYKEAFERSQDPLVGIVRDIGGGLSGVKDWVSSKFSTDRPADE
jgi:Zn-dependent protease with chaperone function